MSYFNAIPGGGIFLVSTSGEYRGEGEEEWTRTLFIATHH